jgi:hypothetical protein
MNNVAIFFGIRSDLGPRLKAPYLYGSTARLKACPDTGKSKRQISDAFKTAIAHQVFPQPVKAYPDASPMQQNTCVGTNFGIPRCTKKYLFRRIFKLKGWSKRRSFYIL